MRRPAESVWRHKSFVRVWCADAVSTLGSEVSYVAFPLVAAVYLGAGPLALGILSASQTAAFALLPLIAGALVDSADRRLLLIRMDIARGVVLLVVVSLALAGQLSIYVLCVAGFLLGCCTVVASVGFHALLPSLVDKPSIVAANAALSTSRSVGSVVGPSTSGLLFDLLAGPAVLLADALSYGASALLLAGTQTPAHRHARRRDLLTRRSIINSLKSALQNSVLRALILQSASYNFFFMAIDSLIILFAVRNLELSSWAIGLVFSIGGIGAVTGASAAGFIAKHVALGRVFIGSAVLATWPWLAVWLLRPGAVGTAMLAVMMFVNYFGMAIFNIYHVSLRQSVVPTEELGRVSGSIRFLNWGAVPLGGLLGGVLGSITGLQSALLLMAVGLAASTAFVVLSPVRLLATAEDVQFRST